jgi:para-aminobenzoate synthetase component II
MTSLVHHDGSALYAGLPDPFTATRYHSLAIVPGTLPDELTVTSRTDSGVIMGVAHRTAPIVGVQFHPESVLTEGGYRLLGNWLASIGYPDAATRGAALSPRR